MIKVEKDNVLLSIDEEDLGQYEARGYSKVGATKKVAPAELEKENKQLSKKNNDLTAEVDKLKEEKEKLIADVAKLTETNETLTAEATKLTEEKETLIKENEDLKKRIK